MVALYTRGETTVKGNARNKGAVLALLVMLYLPQRVSNLDLKRKNYASQVFLVGGHTCWPWKGTGTFILGVDMTWASSESDSPESHH